MPDPRPTGLVILAAGESRRMGQPKQLLHRAGRPLIEHLARAALDSPAWPVVVVTGAHHAAVEGALARLPVLVTENPDWAAGPGTSLRAGLRTLLRFSRDIAAALVVLGDQPAFSAPLAARLLAEWRTSGRPLAATRWGEAPGPPVGLERAAMEELLASTDPAGARDYLDRHREKLWWWDAPELTLDLDTPEDYAAWVARWTAAG